MKDVKKQTGSPSRGERELATGSIPHLFVKFVIPGMLALFLLSAQVFVDGILVGNFVGANAMAAINLVIPLYSLLIAFAIVMCVGCQCTVGMKLGEGDLKTANDALKTGLVFAVTVSGAAGIVICMAAPFLITLMGANTVLADDAVSYIRVLALFFPLPVAMFMSDAVVKATGRPIYATCGMVTMVVSNVVLDLLFIVVFGWGVAGAALATGISYAAGLTVYLPALLHRHTPVNLFAGRFKTALVGKILYIGSAEGVTELSAAAVTLMFNITLMDAAGEKGVAAFTAINYLNFILMACIIGMSEGIRSIISYNHGMGNPERIAKTLKLAARVTGVIAIVTFTSFAFFGRELVSLFFNAKESDIVTFAAHGTAILAFAYLFNGFNILIAGYFTSIGEAKRSLVISLLRGCGLLSVFLFILPPFFGVAGIWMTVPIAEAITLAVGVLMYLRRSRAKRAWLATPAK